MTARQIEAARVAMTRFIKRGGKIWVRVFPDKPITKKPQETRMGKGKGAPEEWVCVVRPGRILFEMEGVTETEARRAMQLAAAKLPIKTQVRHAVRAGEGVMKAAKSASWTSTSCAPREGARRSAVPAAHPEVDGAARGAGKVRDAAPRPGADQDDPAREGEVAMNVKAEVHRHGRQRQDGQDAWSSPSSARCVTRSTARSSAGRRSSSRTTRTTKPRSATPWPSPSRVRSAAASAGRDARRRGRVAGLRRRRHDPDAIDPRRRRQLRRAEDLGDQPDRRLDRPLRATSATSSRRR